MIGKRSVLKINVLFLIVVLSLFIVLATTGSALNLEDYENSRNEEIFTNTGSKEDPYYVKNWTHLDAIRSEPEANYILKENLTSDSTGFSDLANEEADDGRGWEPIEKFSGTFDGNGYRIEDLFIDRERENVGLFGKVEEQANIRNIRMKNTIIRGGENTGGLVGFNWGELESSFVEGQISGKNNTGGIVGFNRGELKESYSMGEVKGAENIGGFVGHNLKGDVDESLSLARPEGKDNVGGLIGKATTTGHEDGTITNSFWDVEKSEIEVSEGGTGKNTTELTEISTYTDTEKEGLDEPWNISIYGDDERDEKWLIDEQDEIKNGFPYHGWEKIIEPSDETFVISDIRIEPESPEEGDNLTITGEVRNEADVRDEFTPDIEINNESITSESLTVDSRGREEFALIYEVEEPGDHHLQVGGEDLKFSAEGRDDENGLMGDDVGGSVGIERITRYGFLILLLLLGLLVILTVTKNIGLDPQSAVSPEDSTLDRSENLEKEENRGYILRAECYSCGEEVPLDAEKCPICKEKFDEEVIEIEEEESDEVKEGKDIDSEIEVLRGECPICGAELEIDTDRCPGCKEPFGSEAEEESIIIGECLSCGKEVELSEERCPNCQKILD